MTTLKQRKQDRMYEDIRQHGQDLLALFPQAKEQDTV